MARFRVLFLSLLLIALMAGCDDSTRPTPTLDEGGSSYDGLLDPSVESFVLQRLEIPVPGTESVVVELLGSNLQVDAQNETVSIDVALHNQWHRALYPPAILWLSQFRPATVTVLNADVQPDSIAMVPEIARWGFDYSESLGGDGVLSPDETSASRTWIFHDPGLGAFSFAAEGRFALEPAGATITGMCFEDLNANGIHDRNEGPFVLGGVELHQPDGTQRFVMPNEDGLYRFPITQTGLYRLHYVIMVDCICCVTTSNPLELLIPPGPDGGPQSYYGADFGAHMGPCCDFRGPVQLVDLSVSFIDSDPYVVLDARVVDHRLQLVVGFSGCGPDHPFTLYADENYAESNPVQTTLLLSHDDRDELCAAWFQRCLSFDLLPLQERYVELYGEPGVMLLRFVDYEGNTHELYYGPGLLPE